MFGSHILQSWLSCLSDQFNNHRQKTKYCFLGTFKYSQCFITKISSDRPNTRRPYIAKICLKIQSFFFWFVFSSLCFLAVHIEIIVQPQSQQAPVGSRVLLTCRASGPPELQYQWFRGKEEVKPLNSNLFIVFLIPVWLTQNTNYCNKLVVWLAMSSDLGGDRTYSRVGSVSFSSDPPGSLYL